MATQGSYLRSPIVVTYRRTERSKKKLTKILRGKTSDNIDKLISCKVPGITENTVIDHVGVGYKFVPDDKLTAADRQHIKDIEIENIKMIAK